MENIVSKANEKVKYIKSLNEKKYRQKYGVYYLEGIKVVNEIIELYEKKAINVKFIAYSYDILSNLSGGSQIIKKISKLNEEKKIEIVSLSKEVFEYMTDTVTPQGILAVLDIPKYDLNDVISNENANILLLDKVQDLGNIGTIIRTADAFEVDTILCVSGTADVYSPKALRSTMGSILREKIIYIESDELDKLFYTLKQNEYTVIGTSLQTDKYINETDINDKKLCFVVGNEANGMSEYISNKCDELVKIPMSGSAESLNAAVATSIILYEQYKVKNKFKNKKSN